MFSWELWPLLYLKLFIRVRYWHLCSSGHLKKIQVKEVLLEI